MAILSNGKFYGFLCSVKETGRKLANGVKEYVEDFVSGFAGHGWKLWEYVKGKWKLEIDTIVVRETMLVFEMLISKVRAIVGAQAITQGHGKVKSVRRSEDGSEYLVELEDKDLSIAAHDFVRCQTFTGDNTKLYHVEVSSVDVETRTLHIPISEFDQDGLGAVLNPPMVGDELVQFGNSQNKDRQSAIYMHADETGQPAIDVMFDVDSKNWEGKVKIRLGGDIPGANGLKGFYCENGMIKGVDNNNHITYCIYPDGSAEFGDGSAAFRKDKSGFIAGGAISWIWDEAKGKCVCTMQDVVLTWDNLSDEVKENLKGEPGNNGLDIIWKDESSIPPANPKKNWVYRNTNDKKVYIYNGTAWVLMVSDGITGTPGDDGKDGKNVYITYHDGVAEPAKPEGNGTTGGWHTNATSSVIWMSQKVSDSAVTGEWGDPIRIKGNDGKPGQDANLLPWIEKWNGYATELGEEYIVTPKMFSGTKTTNSEGKVLLTGIAQGKDCLTTADGTKRTGIFALVDNEIVFELDPISKRYKFTGEVKATSGIFNNVIVNNSVLKDVKIKGTVSQPWARSGIYVNIGSDEKVTYDNIASGSTGGWGDGSILGMITWTLADSGRIIRIANWKYDGVTFTGTVNIPAPSGMYFFEDGIQKSELTLSREVVEMIGYGDSKNFYGWIVLNRIDLMTTKRYGQNFKILATGTVNEIENGASIQYKTYDGDSMSVSRKETGAYLVWLPWSINEQFTVFLTGRNSANGGGPIKASIAEIYSNAFEVHTSDNSNRRDGSFNFMVVSTADWK